MRVSRRLSGALLVLAAIAVVAPVRAAVAPPVPLAPVPACEDYYNPPWGYPPDYCVYEIWDQPVHADGLWYNGPIYTRVDNNVRVFWIHGRWRRHTWTGPLPAFRWGRRGYVNWHGKSVLGKYHWRFGSRRNWRGRGLGPRHGPARHH